ncbi:serine/threonine protein kinase [Wenzhouxiangella sediminis]|uniref:Stress response kinase A n=1 Tax=Wenzhouxiangella sediminis TaxID=1792836 RepID=A0A3E1KAI3_9GAMM|nr:serine/threonine protein kinase [Wenzhouxiangella sediminis]RFF31358.1 serine/threonine protein kinase [Wenzhouxiangella sediminis]
MNDEHDNTRPYDDLGPEVVLDAVEALGLVTDGRLLALNSFENRVWQVGLEEAEPVVVKFYRPGRWSDEAIEEEHTFSLELAEAGLSVVAPLRLHETTLHRHEGFRLAVFPRRGGHAPEPAHEPTLRHLGRTLGRLHAVGSAGRFEHRPELTIVERGREPVDWLLDNQWLPLPLEQAFSSLAEHLLEAIGAAFERAGDYRRIRLHGDCHPGNILWRDDQAHFVDLDDCLTGPAVQDLWMLISGSREDREQQLGWMVEEYRAFQDFDPRELHLVEALRTLRMIYYQAWLARRWDDPAFPAAFPWFGDDRHWETVIGQLREQLAELSEPPLSLEHV